MQVCRELLELRPTIVRGNPSEIMALAGVANTTKVGCERVESEPSRVSISMHRKLERNTDSTVSWQGSMEPTAGGRSNSKMGPTHNLAVATATSAQSMLQCMTQGDSRCKGTMHAGRGQHSGIQ